MDYDKEATNKYSPETLMLGFGYNPWWSEGSVKPPIFLTSTFLFRSAEEGEEFFKIAYGLKESGNKPAGLIYSRLNNPGMEILEDRLKLWEGAEASAVFSSGMAAISTMTLALCKPGDQIVYSIPVYGGTDFFFAHILPEFQIEAIPIEGGENFPEKLREMKPRLPRLRIVFVETPANPTIAMTDIREVVRVRDELFRTEHPAFVAVDNTFLGPVFQKPIALGADLSLYSATKFLGGHSDLIAGAIVANKQLIQAIKNYRTILGSMIGPFCCWLLLRSLETLKIRMETQARSAGIIARWLQKFPGVGNVFYPDLLPEGSRQRAIYERQCSGPGSVISFELDGGKAKAFRTLNALKVCKLAVSLGGTETLIEHPATMTHSDVAPEIQARAGITEGLIRLSVGIENTQDILSDLEQALNAGS